MDKAKYIKEFVEATGKGKMACDINLTLSHWDIDKAIARMTQSYPSLEVDVEKLRKKLEGSHER